MPERSYLDALQRALEESDDSKISQAQLDRVVDALLDLVDEIDCVGAVKDEPLLTAQQVRAWLTDMRGDAETLEFVNDDGDEHDALHR